MWAENSIALPWNTTKTGVESSDPIWVQVRGEMIKAGKQVITLLNLLKLERRALNSGEDPSGRTPTVPITSTLAAANYVSTADLRGVEPTVLRYVAPNPEVASKSDGKRIAYSVSPDDFGVAAALIGSSKAAEVGRRTFEYFLHRESD